MSNNNEEIILSKLEDIGDQLTNLDEAIRGSQDGSRAGLREQQAELTHRVKRLEKGAVAAGSGLSATLAAAWAYLTKGH